MKQKLLLFIFFICSTYVYAQTGSIKGTITDTLNHQKLAKTVVALLRAKDSVLYTFTRSTTNGNFFIKNIEEGKYILLVTYPTYADYVDTFSVNANSETDLGNIILTTKAHLLEDVTVVSKIAAVRMKGDTIVYKADSFKVKEGATVEDLLKKFPGIQVDKKGNITAQGTRVDKVLVDGEEFFGDDPTIATKNLNADMVNEVQVFDKKSDQTTFTGVDDGQTTRTINLKLKDNIKKGWFGKLEASAGGANDIWNNNLMANSFKNKRKLSVFGIASSTGKTGLNWDEMGKYGSNDMSMFSGSDDGGGMVMYFDGGDFDSPNYWGEGIPKSWSTGINYANKFNNDKQQLNGNYKYGKVLNEGFGTTRSQSILPDTLFFNNEKRNVWGNKDKHSISGTFDWMIDSSLSVKTSVTGVKGKTTGSSLYYSESLNDAGNFVNTSNRKNASDANNQSLSANILFRKKFKKVGRTLSLNINNKLDENNSTSFLFSENDFYNKLGAVSFSDTTDQKKINNSKSHVLTTKLAYTEQLAKNFLMELSYGLNINKSQNKVLSYDKNTAGKYDSLNAKYSNSFNYSILTNLAGVTFNYNKKKLIISAGGNIAFANFNQKDLIKDTSYAYNYTNIFPRVNFNYKISSNQSVSFNYNGSTKQPTIQQIQPVADNKNPLFIQVGNPDLIQEFNHRFYLRYNNYKVLKERGYSFNFSYNTTSNAIRSSSFTDTLGRTVSQYVNLNGNNNYRGYISYYFKSKKLNADFDFSYSYNASNNVSIVNQKFNNTKNNSHSFQFSFSKEKEKLFNFWLYANIDYNISTSSIRPDINTNYWSSNIGADITFELPWKLTLNNEFNIDVRQATPLFTGNNNLTVWNAYVSRKIFKGDKSEIRFSAFDILNEKKGYSRSINSTTLTENSYQQLSQYFLVSFIWNFTKSAPATK